VSSNFFAAAPGVFLWASRNQNAHPHTTTGRVSEKREKEGVNCNSIDRLTQAIYSGGLNKTKPPVSPDSPSPRASLDALFGCMPRACIGQYILPQSTLWCVQIASYAEANMSMSDGYEIDWLSSA
jgi:hypothetical protein